ncbi:MAG TPA: hypothetical protein VG308_16720 [Stellaceae bacterium]|nr:hypothetical protein [Stellaceae bacterium]
MKRRYIKGPMRPPAPKATVVTINRADVVADIERAADSLTGGNKTEAVALAVRRLLDHDARTGSLFGRHAGSVRFSEGVDPIAPALDILPDAETGHEIER